MFNSLEHHKHYKCPIPSVKNSRIQAKLKLKLNLKISILNSTEMSYYKKMLQKIEEVEIRIKYFCNLNK